LNPYSNQDFFGFFFVLFRRLPELLTGQIGRQELASDEVQMFVLACLGISSALCGTFLVLKKMAMMANSISHTILLGIVPAFLLGSGEHFDLFTLVSASLIAALLTALFTQALYSFTRLQIDASLGIVFTSLFALGIVLATLLTRNAHIGAETVMGNVDALHPDDMQGAFAILLFNLSMIILFFRYWQITTFDSSYATLLGIPANRFNYLLLFLASLTLVGSFRAVGVLMVLTLITAPALMARLFSSSLKQMLLLSTAFALTISLAGVALSRHFLSVYDTALSTGGLIVTMFGTIYLILIAIKRYVKT
jgi:manganese/zinc/iron transport system permease protein